MTEAQIIKSAADAYNLMSRGDGTAVGGGQTYREVRLDGWPTSIHYEFVARTSRVNVEWHWQAAPVAGLEVLVRRVHEQSLWIFEDFQPRTTSNARQIQRLCLELPQGTPPHRVARTMHHLVVWSRPLIDQVVPRLGVSD